MIIYLFVLFFGSAAMLAVSETIIPWDIAFVIGTLFLVLLSYLDDSDLHADKKSDQP